MKKTKDITRRQALASVSASLATSLISGNTVKASGKPKRVEEADYALQKNIPGLSIPNTITIIGCGGFGAWPALLAALSGVNRLVLFDPANIDNLDLARAPFSSDQVGKPKVNALRDLITHMRPNVSVEVHAQLFTLQDAKLLQGEVVFDGTNDMKLAKELPNIAKQMKMKYVTGFYNGQNVGVMNSYMPGLQLESGTNTPVWLGGAALSGILALNSAFLTPITFVGAPKDLNMSISTAQKKLLGNEAK